MAKQVFSDPVSELGRVLGGGSLERLKDVLTDGDAYFSAGELARMGAAFSQVGDMLTSDARAAVSPSIEGMVGAEARIVDCGVTFAWRRGGESVRVDSRKVKELFPYEEEPELYARSVVRPSVAITIADGTPVRKGG